jgi:outer membrane lipoprotein LolB
MRISPRALALSFAVAFVGGCATGPQRDLSPTAVAAIDAPFSIGGRLSARRGDAGVAGGFSWTHDARHDAIDLASPLGQTLARLEGNSSGVSVTLQNGRTEQAASWRELTERAFGVTIPVDGLASWVRGVPRPGARYTVERDAQARVSLLRQDGWEIVYAYADDAARRPARVVLTLPGAEAVDVRVVVDRWE